MRRLFVAFAAIALLTATVGLSGSVRLANAAVPDVGSPHLGSSTYAGNLNCPHGGNYASTACFGDAVQYSDYTEFHNNTMTVSSSYLSAGYHMAQIIWAYSGSPCNYWIETGYTHGFHKITSGYTWYWARNSSYGGYADYQSATTSPDGTNHSYELDYIGNASYSAYRDGSLLGSASGLGYGTCMAQAGLEESANVTPNAGYEADTTDPTPLRWTDTSGFWHDGWNTTEWYVDYPCGQGQNPPYCLNGVYYGSDHWSDNKPLQ